MLTYTLLPDCLPRMLFLRYWTLFPKGIHYSFLLVADPTRFPAPPDSLIHHHGVHNRGILCIDSHRHAIH